MIYFDNVTKAYPNNCVALSNITFSVAKGEFVSIVGRSGAGKSTLLRLLLAEEEPTKGNIVFEDINVTKMSRSYLSYYRRRMGVIYQDYRLLPQKTIFENVAFALEIFGKGDSEIRRTVPQALELVGILDKTNNFPNQLSGGEQQRAVMATHNREVVNTIQKRVVVLDEGKIIRDEQKGRYYL
jgi:cell division transport system ATP-binding protein